MPSTTKKTPARSRIEQQAIDEPWVLVRRGGVAKGKRPATRLALIVAASNSHLRGYGISDAGRWTKNPVRIEHRDIVWRWARKPSAFDVELARKNQQPVLGGL